MRPGPPSLEDLVRAICEGRSIDWGSLETDASPGFHNKLAALRVVESIARVHEAAVSEGTPSRDNSTEGSSARPDRWGHLELQEHLASGAFGDVYRAWDLGLDREVALKLLRRSIDADAHADEALEEGRLLAKVRHPNIVTVHGAARFDGRAGIWMEFVRGRTLADVIAQEGPLPAARVVSIGAALCHALSAVHAASLVHRDVKPQNVMVGDDRRIVLMDFGAGGTFRHAGLHHAGTPRYLAPEVAAGGPATVQSDIYSLGVTLRYLLTASLSERSDFVPKARAERRLLAILERATNARPYERFESTEDFAAALATFSEPRWSVVAVTTAAALAVALTVVTWATLRTGNPDESRRIALEASWQAAIPTRAPLTPDQSQRVFAAVQGTFSLHGILSGTTAGNVQEETLFTFDPESGDTRAWLTYSRAMAHAESPALSPDNSVVTFVWNDHASRCASLRTVDRTGHVRTLVSEPDIVSILSGASTSRLLPIVIGYKTSQFDLAIIDSNSGNKRVLRTLPVDPSGFSLSPDGRFVAFDVPGRSGPGVSRDIIIHDVSSSQEWALLDEAGGNRTLPIWSPRGDQLFYLETFKDTSALHAVSVVNGHRSSPPAVLRRDLGSPHGMGFVDADTFAYLVETGRSDVMVVEAAADGGFKGQNPRRIGQGAVMPSWSPDGRWLSWAELVPQTGGIRISGGDSVVVRRLQPSLDVLVYPAWSPDSKQLAFFDMSRVDAILKVADAQSGVTREVVRLPRPQFEAASGVAWMPGGRELLITPEPRHIVAVDIATGTRREIHVTPPSDDLGDFFVSPDGNSLLFCEGHDESSPIYIIPLNPRGLSIVRPASNVRGEALVGWWPDGSLFETRRASHPDGPVQDELVRLPLSGAPEPLGIKGTNILNASVTLDGKRIAYSTQTWGQELWLLKPVAQR